MKTNNFQDAMESFLSMNPDIPQGEDLSENVNKDKYNNTYKSIKLVVAVERKGRGGKTATIIEGFDKLSDTEIKSLAKELKQSLGVGGSERGGSVLIQGDFRKEVVDFFKSKGFNIK